MRSLNNPTSFLQYMYMFCHYPMLKSLIYRYSLYKYKNEYDDS